MPEEVKQDNPATNGRDRKGRFSSGNTYGCTGGYKKAISDALRLKQALIDSITSKDIQAIARGLLIKAKSGDVPAIKELFDRLWGRAPQTVDLGIVEDTPQPATVAELRDALLKAEDLEKQANIVQLDVNKRVG